MIKNTSNNINYRNNPKCYDYQMLDQEETIFPSEKHAGMVTVCKKLKLKAIDKQFSICLISACPSQ